MSPAKRGYRFLCEGYAGDVRLPLWLRVASLANGLHQADGQAHFQPGELASRMATWNQDASVLHAPSRQNVSRAIATAVEYGFLAEGSKTTCLRVPFAGSFR